MQEMEWKRSQEKYAAARLAGIPKERAAQLAGYSEKTPPRQIEEQPRVKALIDKALADHQMDEHWLIGEYKSGMAGSLQPDAKSRDHTAHALYLKNLQNLMGYGTKQSPAVAVQINNHSGESASSEPLPTAELVGALSALVEELRAQARQDQPSGVHEGGAGASDPPACEGVAGAPEQPEALGGGGGA